jgi:hypothetical protein
VDDETVTKLLQTLIRSKKKSVGKVPMHYFDSLINAEEIGCEQHVIVSSEESNFLENFYASGRSNLFALAPCLKSKVS